MRLEKAVAAGTRIAGIEIASGIIRSANATDGIVGYAATSGSAGSTISARPLSVVEDVEPFGSELH